MRNVSISDDENEKDLFIPVKNLLVVRQISIDPFGELCPIRRIRSTMKSHPMISDETVSPSYLLSWSLDLSLLTNCFLILFFTGNAMFFSSRWIIANHPGHVSSTNEIPSQSFFDVLLSIDLSIGDEDHNEKSFSCWFFRSIVSLNAMQRIHLNKSNFHAIWRRTKFKSPWIEIFSSEPSSHWYHRSSRKSDAIGLDSCSWLSSIHRYRSQWLERENSPEENWGMWHPVFTGVLKSNFSWKRVRWSKQSVVSRRGWRTTFFPNWIERPVRWFNWEEEEERRDETRTFLSRLWTNCVRTNCKRSARGEMSLAQILIDTINPRLETSTRNNSLNERTAKRGLFIFIQRWASVWRRSGGRRGRVKPSITSRWLFEDIFQVKPEDVREECAQGMSRWSLANGFEEWSDSEHRLESPSFRRSQPWRNVILLPRKRWSVFLFSSASEWDNANAWPIQSSMSEFGEQEKGEEKLLEYPRTIRLSMPIIDCCSLPLRDAVQAWGPASQTSDWCGDSSWPIAAERGTIEMERWSVLSTAMKNKDWILLDPLNSIETRNRCWKVWMNEWMLLPIVEVTSPLYSSSVENLRLSNVKTWRSAVWQTELLPKDRSNDEKEDRRLRWTSSRRTIAPFIEEELNSFFWTLTTNKQFNCHESLKYQFDRHVSPEHFSERVNSSNEKITGESLQPSFISSERERKKDPFPRRNRQSDFQVHGKWIRFLLPRLILSSLDAWRSMVHWGECWVVFVLQPKRGLLLNDGGEQQGGKGERVKVHKDVPIACHERGMSHKARQRTNITGDEKSLVRDVRRSSINRGESLELHSSTPNVSRLVCFQAQLILLFKHHQAPCIHFLQPLVGVDATFDSYSSHSSRRLFEVDLFVFLSKSRFTDRVRTQRRAQLFIITGIEKTCSLKVSWTNDSDRRASNVLLLSIRIDCSLVSSSLPSNAEKRLGGSRIFMWTPRAKNCVLALLVGSFFFYCRQTSAFFTRSISTDRDFPSWSLRFQL